MTACEWDPNSQYAAPALYYKSVSEIKRKVKGACQKMFNEVKELYALLNMILLHACLKWQQRQEVKQILYFTFKETIKHVT